MTTSTDVIVIGGGPAGATVSTLLAQKGYQVELFERDHFPRFHIGESMIPDTYFALKRTGLLEKMKTSHFVKKYSVQFINQHGKLSEPFYFWDNKPHESSQTWQVVRSEFDKLNLDHARENGVHVHEGVACWRCCSRGRRRSAFASSPRTNRSARCARRSSSTPAARARSSSTASACASGTRSSRRRRCGPTGKGACRDTGRDEGATLVIQTQGKTGWFWYIPQHDDTVSVGVVADHDYLFKRGTKDPEAIYFEEVAKAPGLQPRLKNATRATSSASRRSTPIAPSRAPATAGCWSATPSASSTRSTRRACCWR